MKKLLLLIPIVFIFNACSQVDGANPSQNKVLNAVGGKKEKKPALMQNLLDDWLKNEWSPTVSGAEAPTGQTKVKIIPNEDGTAKLVEAKTGIVLKEMTKEQVKKRKEVQEKYKEKDRDFTLQEYIDKMAVYNSTHVSDEKNSHTKKINTLPVIGTTRR
ncbi:MAG: hypothetical protein KAS26_04230 [Sulfurimonas sp.]|nr:hypothetical protein [Sulfurimonas sp.]